MKNSRNKTKNMSLAELKAAYDIAGILAVKAGNKETTDMFMIVSDVYMKAWRKSVKPAQQKKVK